MPFDLAASLIDALERDLGASLPKSFADAMRAANGGELDVDGDDWQQYPIEDTSDRKRAGRTANHVLKETGRLRQWARFPQEALAIAENGSGDQLVLLRDGNRFGPAIHRWAHETGLLTKVADDFSELRRA